MAHPPEGYTEVKFKELPVGARFVEPDDPAYYATKVGEGLAHTHYCAKWWNAEFRDDEIVWRIPD